MHEGRHGLACQRVLCLGSRDLRPRGRHDDHLRLRDATPDRHEPMNPPAPRRSVAATVLLALALSAVPASASAETITAGRVEAGPVFAGGALTWGKRYRNGRLALVVREADGTTRPIFRAPPPPPPPTPDARTSNWIGEIAASSDYVAFEHGDGWSASSGTARASSPTYAVGGRSRFMAGPLTAPFQRLSGYPGPEGCTAERTSIGAFDLERSTLAYSETAEPCDTSNVAEFRLTVTDLATGEILARILPRVRSSPTPDVALTGRFVALIDAITYVPTAYVYDWTTQTLLYRVRYPRGQIYLREIELRKDGSLVLLSSNEKNTKSMISVASQAQPRARPVITASELRALRVARGRILTVRGFGKRRSDDTWTNFEPVVADFRGRTAALARYGPKYRLVDQPDFDGRRAMWAIEPAIANAKRASAKIRLVKIADAWARRRVRRSH